MKINVLLEELINIAKKPKTDFALSMNMTPSGLSKILTGKRVPSMKERKPFTRQASHYFAEAIYAPSCYLKLGSLFPILYDFESQEDLQTFLSAAIAYALDDAFTEESSLDLNYADRGLYYLGRRPVLNQLCIILSDYVVSCPNEPLELFTFLPLLHPTYSRIFQKLILTHPEKFKNVTLNYFFDDAWVNGANGIEASRLLTLISRLQKHMDLNFYEFSSDNSYFALFKGKLLLLFNVQLDGTPLLIPVYHKGYLTILNSMIVKKSPQKCSYSRSEALRFLEENPQFITDLQSRGIDSAYNFMSMGYLLSKQELESTQCPPIVYDAISKFFACVMSNQTDFIVSVAAMERFASLGRAIVPLIGAFPFRPELRVDYLRRFNEKLSTSQYDKLMVVDSEFSNIAAFTSQDLLLIYTLDDTFTRERIHAFHSPRLVNLLYRELCEDNNVVSEFSRDLWNTYLEGLTSIGIDPNG